MKGREEREKLCVLWNSGHMKLFPFWCFFGSMYLPGADPAVVANVALHRAALRSAEELWTAFVRLYIRPTDIMPSTVDSKWCSICA